jgi:tetratricopeptide (TPR) repeat protein
MSGAKVQQQQTDYIPPHSRAHTDNNTRTPLSLIEAAEALLGLDLDQTSLCDFRAKFEDDFPLETTLAILEASHSGRDMLQRAQRIVAMRPRDADGLRVLALAFGVCDQLPFAVATAMRAVKLAPHDLRIAEESAHWQRVAGFTLKNTSWITKAALVFDELAERDPQNAEYPFYAGMLKVDMNLYKPAELSLKEAIARNPRHARAHKLLGDALLQRGAKLEAQQAFLKAGDLFAAMAASSARQAAQCYEHACDAFFASIGAGFSRTAAERRMQKLPRRHRAMAE